MKVAVVSYGLAGGGAARAANRLVNALCKSGLSVEVHTSEGARDASAEPTGSTPANSLSHKLRSKAASGLMRLQRSDNPVLHTPAVFPSRLAACLNRSDADVVNLHWVAGELLSVENIGEITKPIAWTMHDSWAFSGSEHHQADEADRRFADGYDVSNRPSSHQGLDLDRWVWTRKHKAWRRPMTIVSPGEWLAARARQSKLMRGWPIKVIPNPIPLGTYHPRPDLECRHHFGLGYDTEYVLFSAAGTPDRNKGWPHFVEAMTALHRRGHPAVAVLLGGTGRDLSTCDFPHLVLDALTADDEMARLYAAVNVVAVPSRVETFPQMATEALACGTPVVAFRCSGLQDVVRHQETGYLAEPFSSAELAKGLAWTLEPANLAVLSRRATDHATREWSEEATASQYRALFEAMLRS